MARASRILGVLFLAMVVLFVAVVVTDGHPGTLLRDLDDLRRRVMN